MQKSLHALATTLSAALLLTLTGCPSADKPADPHAGHDHGEHGAPATLGEAHHQMEEMIVTIKAAFEAGEPKKADAEIHGIGDIIEDLAKIAEKTGVGMEEELKGVSDDLLGSFMKLDEVAHGKGDTKWEDVGPAIEAAMEKLEGMLPEGEHGDHDEAGHHAGEEEGAGHDEDHGQHKPEN